MKPPSLVEVLVRWGVFVGGFFLVVGLLGFLWFAQFSAAMAQFSKMGPPVEAVSTTVAKLEPWEEFVQSVGSFEPVQGVQLAAEESGKVVEIRFEPGALVKAGQSLLQQDITVEQAQLATAEARIKSTEARGTGAQARLRLAEANLKRAEALRRENANTEEELDRSRAEVDQSKAEVVQLAAEVQQVQGEIASLRATIARKSIAAPFDGRLGLRHVQLGQFLRAGDTVVELQKLDSLYLNFSLPQQALGRLEVGQRLVFGVDVLPGEEFEGRINAIRPAVNAVTRQIEVQATVPNEGERLRAGMFAKVRVQVGTPTDRVTVPQTAVLRAPYGDSVYIVGELKNEKTGGTYLGVRPQTVQLGATRGDQVAILSGLEPGQEVVTSGLFKLRPGAEVTVNNTVQPSNQAAPTPRNE